MTETPDPNALPGSNPTPAGPPPAPGAMGYQPPLAQPGPMGYTPPPPPKKGNKLGLIILGVIGLVVVGGVIYVALNRDSLTGDVNALQVGDCIDEPEADDEIDDVQHVPCTRPHDAEVFAVLTHPAAEGEAYPIISGFDDYIGDNCLPLWETYTGRTWATEVELDIGYFHPTLSAWADGGRNITCYTIKDPAGKLYGSVKNIGASALPVATP